MKRINTGMNQTMRRITFAVLLGFVGIFGSACVGTISTNQRGKTEVCLCPPQPTAKDAGQSVSIHCAKRQPPKAQNKKNRIAQSGIHDALRALMP